MSAELATVTSASEEDLTQLAVLLGMDPRQPKTRAMVMVAHRYGLDPLLKHVVVIPNSGPYITRDGLLHVAHRSGQFDGIELGRVPAGIGERVRHVLAPHGHGRDPLLENARRNAMHSATLIAISVGESHLPFLITPAQRKKLWAQLKRADMENRDVATAWMSSLLGVEVTSTNQLTQGADVHPVGRVEAADRPAGEPVLDPRSRRADQWTVDPHPAQLMLFLWFKGDLCQGCRVRPARAHVRSRCLRTRRPGICPACGGTGRRVVAPPPRSRGRTTDKVHHGYSSTYQNGCRCDLCRAGWRQYVALRKQKQKQAKP